MVYAEAGSMFTSISFWGTGTLICIVGVLLAYTRALTKKELYWGPVFGSIACFLGIIMPNTLWGGTLFLLGIIGWLIGYYADAGWTGSLTAKNTSIWDSIKLGIMLNITLLLLFGAASTTQGISTLGDVNDQLRIQLGNMDNTTSMLPDIDNQLCTAGDTAEKCDESMGSQTGEDSTVFDPILRQVSFASWLNTLFTLLTFMLLGTLVVGLMIAKTSHNIVISTIIIILVGLHNLALLGHVIKWITNRRGQG